MDGNAMAMTQKVASSWRKGREHSHGPPRGLRAQGSGMQPLNPGRLEGCTDIPAKTSKQKNKF